MKHQECKRKSLAYCTYFKKSSVYCSSLHHELLCGSVRNTQNFIHDEISDSENIGEVINANDHDTDNYVDEGDDCNYATDFTDLVDSDQVDDLIDLEDDEVIDELDYK